jgi:hypothetical protein
VFDCGVSRLRWARPRPSSPAKGRPCSTVGTIRPRASGKNLYDVSIGASGAGCPTSAATLNGVASYDDASRVLIALTLNGAKNDGVVFSGSK